MTRAALPPQRQLVLARIEHLSWLVGIGLILGFLYLPIAVLVAYSFNASRSLTWPMSGLTLEWYQKLASNSQLIEAFYNSIYVAVSATALTLIIGVPAAIALDRIDFPGKGLFRKLILLPIALPGIITGISMLILFRAIGFNLSLETVIIGHATALLAVVVTQVYARLQRVPASLSEASADLGASGLQTFFLVTLDSGDRGGYAGLYAVFRRDPGDLLPDRARQHLTDVYLVDDAARPDPRDQRYRHPDRGHVYRDDFYFCPAFAGQNNPK